jgi:hypothetical protein
VLASKVTESPTVPKLELGVPPSTLKHVPVQLLTTVYRMIADSVALDIATVIERTLAG